MSSVSTHLAEVLASIRACERAAGRPEGSVKLIAVSKTQPMESIAEAAAAGQKVFGENRVQELVPKHEAFPHLEWHLIGTLQKNKVKYVAPFVALIHSVDSADLLAEISKHAGKHNRIQACLLQINISEEANKSGMDEREAETILTNIEAYPNVRIEGLMGMAEFTDSEETVRAQFRRLREAREACRRYEGPRIAMKELSMGMSGDYPVAIQEGATMVRIGSAVFGERTQTRPV